MSEILTSKEIDTLLAAISSDSLPDDSVGPKKTKKHIKIYDFKRPDKLSINDVKNIANVMKYFAKSFANNLNESHVCDKTISIHLASVDQLTLEEYFRSIPSPYIVETFKIFDKFGVLELDPNAALRFLGNEDLTNRLLSEPESEKIEADFMTPALTDLIAEFNNAESFFGENKINIEYATNTKFSNNDFVPAWSNQEMCCNCTFEIRLGDRPCYEKVLENVKKGETEKDYVEGFFNITFVCDLAKELSEKMSGKEKELDVKEKIDENLVKNTKVPVEVVLGSTKESLKDILEYKPGKIIELDKLAGEPVEIRANGAVVGTGEVVVVNEKFGVRIVDLK